MSESKGFKWVVTHDMIYQLVCMTGNLNAGDILYNEFIRRMVEAGYKGSMALHKDVWGNIEIFYTSHPNDPKESPKLIATSEMESID